MYILPSKNYIAGQKASTLIKVAEIADDYFLFRKQLLQKSSPQQTFQRTFHSNNNKFEVSSSSTNTADSKPTDSKYTFHKTSWNSGKDQDPACFLCRKRVMSFLYYWTKKGKKAFPNALITLKTDAKYCIPKSEISKDKCESDFMQEVF